MTSGTSGSGGKTGGVGGAAVAGGSGSSGAGVGGSATGGVGVGGSAGVGAGGMSAGAGGTGGGAGAGNGGSGAGPTGVVVQLDKTHQTIEGFGLNTALGNAAVPWDTFFTTTGFGLTIVRVAMDETGQLSGVLPPSSYNAKIIASAWTAPANCKDNNNTQKGGHLLTSCYDSWSTTIAKFAKSQGLYAMGIANEPDFASCGSSIGPPCNGDYDSMVYTAKEMVDFVNAVGPKLKDAGVKLLAPEASEWLHLWSNASATGSTAAAHTNSSDPLKCGCFANDPTTTGCASACEQGSGYDYGHWLAKDPTAWGFIDLLGTHEYDTQKALAWPADVDGGKRSKEVWETELGGVKFWPYEGPSDSMADALAVAEWIHSGLVVGEASAWLWWWYTAESTDDNEGLVLKNSSMLTARCYTMGNYSKFVRPGYVMVEVAGNANTDLLISAFQGPDATVVVAVNKGQTDASVPISVTGGTAPSSCSPYLTSATDKLAARTAVPVTGGTFTAALPATSVTSFVCK